MTQVGDSLGFEMLDRHVVHGRAEEMACSDDTGSMTFARLTERAAELAGGLRMVGVEAGDVVEIDLPSGNVRVTAVCAVIRLGAIPMRGSAGFTARIAEIDGLARVQAAEHDLELSFVQRAGRSEPAASLKEDEAGYDQRARDAFSDIVETLLSGSPVV